MRGHVRKRGKSWCFVIDVGRDPETQKRRQRWQSGFTTRKAAEEAMRKALGRLDVGDDPIPERITVAELAERALSHWEAEGRRTSTLREYRRLLRQRIRPGLADVEVRKVKPAHCQAIIDTAVAEGISAAQLRAVLGSMFQLALRWELTATNPVRATTAHAKQRPKLTVPNAAELRALTECSRGTLWEIPMLLAATTGARRAEVLGLTWAACDLENGAVRVERTLQRVDGRLVFVPPKTGRSRRTIPLPNFALARLRQHRADQSRRRLMLGRAWCDLDLVCEAGDGHPLEPDSFSKGAGRIAAKIGLHGMRLHDVRHGVATVLARSGLAPFETSELLGHASPAFTMSVYQHADAESLERARRGVEEALGS
jgi:integrase